MTFTYTEDLRIDRDFVRFHTGDVLAGESFLSDGVIDSLLSETGSREAAVIAAITHIISRLSKPDFHADWLRVDHAAAVEHYRALLLEKRMAFGQGAIRANARRTYRQDGQEGRCRDGSG